MADRLRVLAIVPSGFCFGLQHLTLAFFGNSKATLDAHFLTTRWSDGEFVRQLDRMGLLHSATWLGMYSRRLDWTNLRMTLECLFRLPVAWVDFLRLIRSFRPDIVYFANHHEIILLLPLLFFIRPSVVCHMHDPSPPITFQKWSFFFWRRAIRRFFFISENVRGRLSLLGRLDEKDVVIYNGVAIRPIEGYARKTTRFCDLFNWPHDSVIFGITGQLSPHKGHEDFILAAALACRDQAHLRFVIGGRGPDAFFLKLSGQIKALGLSEKVGFCGWLQSAQMFYEGIDALVLASRHDEGFGLVIAEAGERGLPVIATRSGGAVEVIIEGETGVIVEKGDVHAMGAAISRLGCDASLRRKLGQAARANVVSHFNLETQSRRFVTLLQGLQWRDIG